MTTNREMTDKEFPVMQYEDAGKEAYAEQRVIFFRADPTLDKLSAHPDGHYERITDAAPSVEPSMSSICKFDGHPIYRIGDGEWLHYAEFKGDVLHDPEPAPISPIAEPAKAPQPVIDDAPVVEQREGFIDRECVKCAHKFIGIWTTPCPNCETPKPTPTVIPDAKDEKVEESWPEAVVSDDRLQGVIDYYEQVRFTGATTILDICIELRAIRELKKRSVGGVK